jgi:hypothetical protein
LGDSEEDRPESEPRERNRSGPHSLKSRPGDSLQNGSEEEDRPAEAPKPKERSPARAGGTKPPDDEEEEEEEEEPLGRPRGADPADVEAFLTQKCAESPVWANAVRAVAARLPDAV